MSGYEAALLLTASLATDDLVITLVLYGEVETGRSRSPAIAGTTGRDEFVGFRQDGCLAALYTLLRFEHSLLPTKGLAGLPDFLTTLARHG